MDVLPELHLGPVGEEEQHAEEQQHDDADAHAIVPGRLRHVVHVVHEVGGEAIPVIGFAQLTFVAAIVGTVMAVVMSHRASRPRHTFLATTLALTALSIVPDVLADAQNATRLTLALTHVIAAAIVIPAISSRLAD